ncbi:hypothetical protein GCK72_008582 [Caenorhabditis remanei]|uniref:F-box domain-containing protein n=1 Tax=Caenorhabditis remanei TaxID=31234 RepID=A0A6A5H127_CAERE|nr:hypothetical protein GCK72_008582 [Caenorhabditis remanei]KAF1760333.1 hypothetical protein GCK72_008582 [Caenorhabditis remanei]
MDGTMFPLVRLPDNALLHVLRSMEELSLILFSLISNRSKILTISANLKLENDIKVLYGTEFTFQLQFSNRNVIDFNLYDRSLWTCHLPTMDLSHFVFSTVQADHFRPNEIEYKESKGWTARQYLLHFLDILHKPDVYFYYRDPGFNADCVSKTMKGVTVKRLCTYVQFEFEKTMKALNYPSEIWFDTNQFTSHESLSKFYIQNFDYLILAYGFLVTLDDLLLMNCKNIFVQHSRLREKHLNIYLKSWLRGQKEELEHVRLLANRINGEEEIVPFTKEIVLKGLKYTTVPADVERLFYYSVSDTDGKRVKTIKGGYDIKRKDGRLVTIVLQNYWPYFDMYVWPNDL